jgi:hypothetical protein
MSNKRCYIGAANVTLFLNLLKHTDKQNALRNMVCNLGPGTFDVDPANFRLIPGSPFAYSVSDDVRLAFKKFDSVSRNSVTVAEGLNTTDNERFLRLIWEINTDDPNSKNEAWFPLAKGGEYARYYGDLYLLIKWHRDGAEMKEISRHRYGSETKRIYGQAHYFRSGLTYSQRSQKGLSFRAFPRGAIFNVKGPAIIDETSPRPLHLLGLLNSTPFKTLVMLQTSFGSYNVGYLQNTPLPLLPQISVKALSRLALDAWVLTFNWNSVHETSHAFLLPSALRDRAGDYDPPSIEAELGRIQTEIDDIAFDLYGFSESDRQAVLEPMADDEIEVGEEDDEDSVEPEAPSADALLSWTVGVAFGRFDWRLATGERDAPHEPEPFDPLPAKSPGMLPNDADPFHAHSGILVDDQGHSHDLAHLVEDVLALVDYPIPDDVRRWLQRKFFAFHLKGYSKSRRKAPIYWPLSTASGSYTLWVYYPELTSETLYSAINDFVEPKLKQVDGEINVLREKGPARSGDEDRRFESLQDLEGELRELRQELLRLAPDWKPNHDDGVQITAAPLWQLFQHRPWQNLLKKTREKLVDGDYDWAHLAMTYWPDRVREKCAADKSIAIAHELENLYEGD